MSTHTLDQSGFMPDASEQEQETSKKASKTKKKTQKEKKPNIFSRFFKSKYGRIITILLVVGTLVGIGYGIYILLTSDIIESLAKGETGGIDLNNLDFAAFFSDIQNNYPQYLEQMWEKIKESFSGIMIWTFIITMLYYGIRDFASFYSEEHYDYKSFLTSIGMLGTFFGITIAMYGFDPENMDESVIELLGGMKLAFVTSALGLFFSLVLTAIQKQPGNSDEREIEILENIEENIGKDGSATQVFESINELKKEKPKACQCARKRPHKHLSAKNTRNACAQQFLNERATKGT